MKAVSTHLHKDIINNRSLVSIIGVALFVAMTALGAYIRVPVPGSPVPITMQTFFVMLSGAVLGKRLGLYSQAGYPLAGVAGLPVFQGASFGAGYLLGPTGGYIFGFLVSAFAIGVMAEHTRKNILSLVAVFAAGSLIIYSSGVLWLVIAYKMSLAGAIASGALPFVLGDLAKMILAAAVYSGISGRARQIFSA